MPQSASIGPDVARRASRPGSSFTFAGDVSVGPSIVGRRYRLANGLTVIVVVDPIAPVVSYQTWFAVGSREERVGKTGLAHLFEHLMFNQTESLPAGQFDRLVERAGGETNAATWVDWTYYYENIPSDELRLVARLEADRMAHLVLRDKQVASEREVVANERRFRVDDDVEGSVAELLYATAYRKHPYRWPTIGWMRDIERFTTQDCRAFYRRWYAPSNATLVLVGDLSEVTALRVIGREYGGLPRRRIRRSAPPSEPSQRSERRRTVRKPTPTEKLQLGYHASAFATPEHAALTVIQELLFGGRSSRLYRALITEGELAAEARGSIAPFRDPGLFEIWVSMREGERAREAQRVIDAALRKLTRELVTDRELEKARNRLELAFLQALETSSGKAEQIGFHEVVLGDGGRLFERLETLRAVTAHDVREAARRYLVPSRRTVITVLPDGRAAHRDEDAQVHA